MGDKDLIKQDDWDRWQVHVLLELKRLGECYTRIENQINQLERTVTALKVAASIRGAIAGFVPALIGTVAVLFKLKK